MDTEQKQQESTRPVWTPVYMGESQALRCLHCGQIVTKHDLDPDAIHCQESFLRLMDGNR